MPLTRSATKRLAESENDADSDSSLSDNRILKNLDLTNANNEVMDLSTTDHTFTNNFPENQTTLAAAQTAADTTVTAAASIGKDIESDSITEVQKETAVMNEKRFNEPIQSKKTRDDGPECRPMITIGSVSPRNFDGDEDVDDWIEHFVYISKCNNWNESMQKRRLPITFERDGRAMV